MSDHISETDKELEAVLGSHKTVIRIIGTGGAGNNTVTRLLEVGIEEVDVIAVNTDAQDLLYAKADHKVLIGKSITNGLGAGSDPTKGEESAKESLEELQNKVAGSDLVFITCGLGGGTGTGSAPIIAEIAKKHGALTIAVVTLPFNDEGIVRWDNARKGLDQLQTNVDTVIVVQNDRLLDLVPDMPLNAAFKVADEILVNAVKGITELVTEKGLVNLDFADVRTIMENGGLAMIGLGESDEMSAEEAATKALENPLLDIDITGAKSALINISGGQELSLKAAKTVMKVVAHKLDRSAKIIWGARLNESMGSSLRVMLIVTCLQSARKSASEVEIAIRKPIATLSSTSPTQVVGGEKVAPEIESMPEPANAEQSNKPAKTERTGKTIFSEIFVEESDADVSVIEDAVKGLSLGSGTRNEKYLRKIHSASSSIHSSAELFGYSRISEFVELIGDITDLAVKGEFELSESLLELFTQLPETLRNMMAGDKSGYDKADETKQKLSNILDLLTQPPEDLGKKGENLTSKGKPTDSGENIFADADTENKAKPEGTKVTKVDENDPDFSNVRETVKYFDKLF